MSAFPTLRGPEAEGAAAGGLVSQRSAEAGSAAEVKTALTRNRLRCTSALHRVVEVAMVSAQPVGSCKPTSLGRLLGVMPISVSEIFRPRALLRTMAASSGTGGRGIPAVAARVRAALADVLDTPTGKYAQLVAAALILRNLTRLPDPGGLAARLHDYTDTLLA